MNINKVNIGSEVYVFTTKAEEELRTNPNIIGNVGTLSAYILRPVPKSKFFGHHKIWVCKRIDENSAVYCLSHEIIHHLLFKLEDRNTTSKFDNIDRLYGGFLAAAGL